MKRAGVLRWAVPVVCLGFALAPVLVALAGCTAASCCPSMEARREAATLDAVIERTLAQARAAEPRTTALLRSMAADAHGTLQGLEHRLKTPKATREKYARLAREHPGTAPEDIQFYDALRYTLAVPERQPGHHRRTVRALFERLEAEGHSVVVLKNYWPRGDTYSGVNAVLRAPDGMLWELQCHTPASYATKSSTHADYEALRSPETPLAERRRLFDKMTHAWDAIPVPAGMLEEKAVHPRERRRVHTRP